MEQKFFFLIRTYRVGNSFLSTKVYKKIQKNFDTLQLFFKMPHQRIFQKYRWSRRHWIFRNGDR